MLRPLYKNAEEWRNAALTLFIDAQQQYHATYDYRMADYIGPDGTFGGVYDNAWVDGEKLYSANDRAKRFHKRLREYRQMRIDKECTELARMHRANRRGMMYPTGMFPRSTDPEVQAAIRLDGREVSRLVGTIVRLSESDPTTTIKGVKELNETMERLVDMVEGGLVNPLAILHTVLSHKINASHVFIPEARRDMMRMVESVYRDFDRPPKSATGTLPVWHQSLWYRVAHKHHTLHPYCTTRDDIPGGIAVAETYARLYAQRFTVMKPGRYLTKYFGNVLTEGDIKTLAQRQIGDSIAATVYFAKTGDEIVWAYENSPRSCMKMNRDERYIDESLDEDIHPVRAYAHPENHLAVAFIMRDRMAKPNYGHDPIDAEYRDTPVHARTIVNTQRKCYYRLYGQNASECVLEEALRALGYVYRADTLAGELLSMQRAGDYLNPDDYSLDRNEWAYVSAPYVDGGYCHVVYERTPEGREQLRILEHNDDWVDGLRPSIVQNSSGVVDIYTGKNWFNEQTCRN
jgi:hypothetical protein